MTALSYLTGRCAIQGSSSRYVIPKEKADELRTEGYREFVLVERMYFADMKVYRNEELPEESDYLSVMYARR